jgi:hypothetical protein
MNKWLCLILSCTFAYSDQLSKETLDPYKALLEWGTYEGQDWSKFSVLPKSRYDTFLKAFDYLDSIANPVVVELGTSRSFTHGGHPGCNLDDVSFWMPDHPEYWDWGAGFFTRMVAISLNHLAPSIHTVDIVPNHINRCKIMTQDVSLNISYHVSSSEDYLSTCHFPNGIDLLYLDTGDMTPIEPTALLQLREAKIIVQRDLIAKNGLILIDDVKNQTPVKFGEKSNLGKSKYSLPYLLDHGFEIVMDEYQVLLRRK